MATATLPVSLEDYLRCSDYEPDAEYVDDHVEARPMGERDHSNLQRFLFRLLDQPAQRDFFICFSELRVRVADRRYRVPNFCLLRKSDPKDRVAHAPPLLCIEILSPEDRMSRTMVRVKDFLSMGVPEVWIVDPDARTVQVCAGSNITIHSEGELKVPEVPVTLSLPELFQALDE